MPRGSRTNRAGGAPAASDELDDNALECVICIDACTAVCVFPCGHFTCYSCGLCIHCIKDSVCPICRVKGESVTITRTLSKDPEHYTEEEMTAIRKLAIKDKRLKCLIDGQELAVEVSKLYENLCPHEGCWRFGEQDPFYELSMLKDHLSVDHKMSYCQICLDSRPAFLCEQAVYNNDALKLHMDGNCTQDNTAFMGHPPCKFCARKGARFYDGEALLKHMQEQHYTCDVCNRGQFTYTFYDNRNKLDQHFQKAHKICDHPDCSTLDLLLRVFADDVDLALHKKRVHGAKGKVVFTPGTFGVAEGSAGSGNGGNTNNSGSPATATNANVIQITFDHIYRIEQVELLPTKQRTHQGRGGNHNKRGGHEVVLVPKGNGLPVHYHKPEVMQPMVLPTTASATARHVDPTSPVSDTPKAISMVETMEAYKVRNNIPADPREQNRLLNNLLERHLSSPIVYARFKEYTKGFTEGKLLTREYYDKLSWEIFPQMDVFNEVYPLLVATVPNAEKKRALQEVWKMRMAPEIRRQSHVRREEEKAAAAREAAAREEAQWENFRTGDSSHHNKKNNNNKKGNNNNRNNNKPAPKNAWLSGASRSKVSAGCSDSNNINISTPSPPPPPPATGGTSVWGGGGASRSAAAQQDDTPALEDLYPTLPNNNYRRLPGAKKTRSGGGGGGRGGNPWFH